MYKCDRTLWCMRKYISEFQAKASVHTLYSGSVSACELCCLLGRCIDGCQLHAPALIRAQINHLYSTVYVVTAMAYLLSTYNDSRFYTSMSYEFLVAHNWTPNSQVCSICLILCPKDAVIWLLLLVLDVHIFYVIVYYCTVYCR